MIIFMLLIAGVISAYAFSGKVRNFVTALTKSPKEYYAYVENQNIDSIIYMINKNINKENSKLARDTSVDLSYNKELINPFLQNNIGANLYDIENFIGFPIDSVGFTILTANEDRYIFGRLGIKLNNKDIFSGEFIVNQILKELLINFSSLSPAYLKQSLDGEYDLNILSETIELITTEKLDDFIRRYSEIFIKNVNNVEISNEWTDKFTITNNVKGKEIKIAFFREDVANITKKILEEAKTDNFFLELLYLSNINQEEYEKMIDEALLYIDEDYSLKSNNLIFTMLVYVDSYGKIIGRDIKFSNDVDVRLGYLYVDEKDDGSYTIIYSDKSMEVNINGSHTKLNDVYNGSLTTNMKTYFEGQEDLGVEGLSDNETVSFDIKYDDVYAEIIDGQNFFRGNINIYSPIMKGMDVNVKCDYRDYKQTCVLTLNMGKTPLITLDASTNYIKNFSIPYANSESVIYDLTTELDSYINTIDFEKFFFEFSENLGINPEELMKNLY